MKPFPSLDTSTTVNLRKHCGKGKDAKNEKFPQYFQLF